MPQPLPACNTTEPGQALSPSPRILMYGFGNPGREDDGLGIALADAIEACNLPGVCVERNYQLNCEDALTISEFDVVIFADASTVSPAGFRFTACPPGDAVSFTTHSMSPQAVTGLCHELYQKYPDTYLLEIRGERWDMVEGLSDQGARNLQSALQELLPLLKNPDRRQFAAKAFQAESTGESEHGCLDPDHRQ